MNNIRQLNVFIGSPNDCKKEREAIAEYVEKYNYTIERIGLQLKPSSWDINPFLGAGRAQERILEEGVNPADICIFLFWSRIGTDAGKGKTGTVEELERALKLNSENQKPEILLFFKTAPISYDSDPEQFKAVRDLKNKLEKEKKLAFRNFEKPEELEIFIFQALSSIINNIEVDETIKIDNSGILKERKLKPELNEGHIPWQEKIKDIQGIADMDTVFQKEELDGRVYSIELLTQPLKLYEFKGNKMLRINRQNAKLGIYGFQAKGELTNKCIDTAYMKQWVQTINNEIHNFILGKNNTGPIEISLEAMPFRWASGGVFPVVRFREKTWTPFFLRDIKPYGWNIPLGASEAKDNLNEPNSFIFREFLEEFLILTQAPGWQLKNDGSLEPIEYRPPDLSDIKDNYVASIDVDEFLENHFNLRRELDRLYLKKAATSPIKYHLKTDLHMGLEIVSGSDSSIPNSTIRNDLLFAVNPFELGIEAVAVINLDLMDKDYILAGEILEPEGKARELVRMPVALISHDYLYRAFVQKELNLEKNNQDSIDAEIRFSKDDIILFDWDIERRRLIVIDNRLSTGNEQLRYLNCLKNEKLSDLFLTPTHKLSPEKIPTLFTPTSAKIACYYLNQQPSPASK